MALDFQQVRQQIITLAENAPHREEELRNLRDTAEKLLSKYALDLDYLRNKVERAANLNKNLRCAIPTSEAFTDTFPLPPLPDEATIIAADGSQINPNRHWALEYCLVNVGAIQMRIGESHAPELVVDTKLIYDEELYTNEGTITEETVALIRDQRERKMLADLAQKEKGTVITITDGPIELYGLKEQASSQRVKSYLKELSTLQKLGAVTAGYVDKPRYDLVVRLLEIAALEDNNLDEAGKRHWLRGITDASLFNTKLNPGERSAIFRIQSPYITKYQDELALHFFYLNVSLKASYPWLAYVEIPSWVKNNTGMLNALHAVLVSQCQIIGNITFPYLLHRAHEISVVTHDDREQVESMILVELYRQGLGTGQVSAKEKAKQTTWK